MAVQIFVLIGISCFIYKNKHAHEAISAEISVLQNRLPRESDRGIGVLEQKLSNTQNQIETLEQKINNFQKSDDAAKLVPAQWPQVDIKRKSV